MIAAPPPPLISRSVSGSALVSQVSRGSLNNHADNFAWTSLKVLWCWRVYLQCFLCFSNLAPERFPRISGLFSSRRPGWNFSYEPKARLRVVPHFSSGIFIEGTKRERAWKSPHSRKGDDFHARSRFVRSTLPEEKWGTTRSLTQGEIHPNIYRASPVNRAHVKRPLAVLFA